MKLAIISDIHDNIESLRLFLKWCDNNKIDALICCGDMTKSSTLNILTQGFNNVIYLVRGNAELYDEEELSEYDNVEYYNKTGLIELDGKKLGFCHEPYFIKDLAKTDRPSLVFYGHTHEPWEGEKYGLHVLNPGTLGDRFMPGTFAFWDTKNKEVELKTLNQLDI